MKTIVHSDNGDISIEKLAKQIERAKTEDKKNSLFLSVYGKDRELLLQHMILSMPKRSYLLKREGQEAPSLEREIINKYGVMAGTSDLEKTIRGLSVIYPDRVAANLTLGLDEVQLKQLKKVKTLKINLPKPPKTKLPKAPKVKMQIPHMTRPHMARRGTGMTRWSNK